MDQYVVEETVGQGDKNDKLELKRLFFKGNGDNRDINTCQKISYCDLPNTSSQQTKILGSTN